MSVQTVVKSSETWNEPQWRFLQSRTRYVDLEGAIRSGKSWALVRKVQNLCLDYPGIEGLLCRYTQDALDAQLKPLFYSRVPAELLGRWDPHEEAQYFTNGSKVYMRALKSSETAAQYSKFQGLTLGFVAVDQAEEIPEDYWLYLRARPSQVHSPMQRILVANPPGKDHWLAREFPDDQDAQDHEYIRSTIRDNARNLPPDYIEDLERKYTPGNPLRTRLLEGKRGSLEVGGDPVYAKYFRFADHVRSVVLPEPGWPIIRGWDLPGPPACVWFQITRNNQCRVIYELAADAGTGIADFKAAVLAQSTVLFPAFSYVDFGDPAAFTTSQTDLRSCADVLRPEIMLTQGEPTFVKRREAIIAWLSRTGAFLLDSRCDRLVDGFVHGYIWREVAGVKLAEVVKNEFSHVMDALGHSLAKVTTVGMTLTQRRNLMGPRDFGPEED